MPNLSKKFTCTNNSGCDKLLTVGRIYDGEYLPSEYSPKWIRIFFDNTGEAGNFQLHRFVERNDSEDLYDEQIG